MKPSSSAPSPNRLVMGVDAGGTKTTTLVAEVGAAGRCCVLGAGSGGGGNPLSGGWDLAKNSLRQSITQAMAASSGAARPVDSAVIAVAGAANDSVRRRLSEWATQEGFTESVAIVPDYEPILTLTQTSGPCVAVIAGTGSVVVSRDALGALHRFGGWGYLLGDEGSGYAIARRALSAALAESESGHYHSPLARLVKETFTVSHPRDALSMIYQSADPRRTLAATARPVLEAIPSCLDAQECVRLEMEELARVIHRGLTRVGQTRAVLGLAGGVLANCSVAREMLISELTALGISPGRIVVVRTPAEGCLLLAGRASGVL